MEAAGSAGGPMLTLPGVPIWEAGGCAAEDSAMAGAGISSEGSDSAGTEGRASTCGASLQRSRFTGEHAPELAQFVLVFVLEQTRFAKSTKCTVGSAGPTLMHQLAPTLLQICGSGAPASLQESKSAQRRWPTRGS